MASASVNTYASTKETTNYARLCRLLVDVGSQALRDTFDKIHPPASLQYKLSSHPVRASLERLHKGNDKILNSIQWGKLYPSNPSSVSSRNFDITLLTVLLRNFSNLNPPTTGWDKPPPATDTSTEADIIRVRVFRNEIYAHASKAYIDNHAFYEYWQDIRQTLIRLGGDRYGPFIDKLKVDCVDPDIGLHYQELLKKWIEDESKIDQIEGNVGCLYAEAEDISLLEPTVDFKSMSKQVTAKAALRTVINCFKSLRKRKAPVCSRAAACGTKENPLNKKFNLQEVSAKDGVNRITSGMFPTEETEKVNKIVVPLLDEAINLYQSDHIAGAREKLQCVFQTVRNLGQRFFSKPTKHSLRVLLRGKELFLEDRVSCSVKHGTLLLDTSNCGAQFYSSLLNVIGAFAVVISEFKMAKETFSLLIDFHRQSDETSSKGDLGAAYNNRGCISLILGDLKQAECDFEASLANLQSAKELHQRYSPLLETMSIAINSNIGRLHLISRNYSKALEKQTALVETCKSKEVNELPLQVVFTLLNNLAVLYTTLGKFSKAEQELKWMVSYCYKMNREDCDYLLNFVALHLSEVLLLHGKPKEAEKAFTLDVDDIDLVEMFGGLHINVRIETVEKLVDLILLKGKIRFACELLETGVNILKSTFGPDHFNVASLLYKQGTVLALAGEVSSAVEKLECSMKILEEKFGIKHPLLLKCYMSLGELALRSKLADESYSYFQRVMENIEAIYQVSFVNQLSRTYLEMTNSNAFKRRTMSEDTLKIEGLVAEHGLVLAVLLSRPVVQDNTLPFRSSKPIASNNSVVHCPYSIEVAFFKYTRDFLQTGQAFLRQGMKKEAATFFQQAKKYCTALDTTRDPTYACIAHLYDVLYKELLPSHQTLKNKYEMTSCLEELSEVNATSKGSTEEVPTTTAATATATATASTATIDDQLNLKFVMIFLILLSIELKMMDMTFAAYDLYSRISQNEDGFLHVLNGENQFYVSKTLVTCNGKTALQDVFVSTVTLTENDSKRPPPDTELYRNLALKKNVPSDSFLVAYTSSAFLDIEELWALDRKISLSVQDCFTQKCFETGLENSATQVVVDLTTTTYTRNYHNGLLIGSRMELLSLCLLQDVTSEIPLGQNISEISTAMYLKTVRLTFEDEHTSHFMFSKNALYLLQQFNSGKISTLSVQHQCLSLTITDPIKARLTVWRKDRSISQKVQFVQTATNHGVADQTVPRQRCSEVVLEDVSVAERVFGPAIDHLANAYQVPCITYVEYSDDSSDVSDVHCEQREFRLDGWQPKDRRAFSLIREQSECLRNTLNASILEGLTVFSELSSQLLGDAIHEDEDDIVVDADTDAENVRCLPSTSQSQIEQEITSSDCHLQPLTLNPEANMQNRNLSLEATNLAGEEVTTEACETYPITMEEEEHDNLLGRSLFEKDRHTRRSWVTDLYHEITRKSNVMNEQDDTSGEITQQVNNSVIGLQNAEKCHTTSSPNHVTRMDISNSSFETSSTEAELRTQNVIQPQSNQGPNDEEAVERHLDKKDTESKGASIGNLCGRKLEEIWPTWDEKVYENEGSAEDQGFHENEQFQNSFVPGQSKRRVKEEVMQSRTDATIDFSITQDGTGNATSDHQSQSNSLSSTHGETQHQHNVQKKTKHTILEEEKGETISPMKIREEYNFQRRSERESSDCQDELLVNEDVSQFFTPANMKKRETCRSSFNVYDYTVPDGPVSETSKGIHNSSIDSRSSRNTDVVDGLLKRPGNNVRAESLTLPEKTTGILTSRRQFVDEICYNELLPCTRRNEKLPTFEKNGGEVSFRTSQFAFLGDDVLADGGTAGTLPKEELVDGFTSTGEAFTTFQDGTKGIFENDLASFRSNTETDDVDGPVCSSKSEANVNDPPGFGGARPKEKSRNSTRRNSLIKTKMTEPISTSKSNETGEIGLKPGFLARHTIKSNGVVLDLPSHDGWDYPYFSAQSCKNIAYGDRLRLLGDGINPLGCTSSSSSQGLYEQAAFAVRTSTQGNAQSLAIDQKPSLNQKESWHFPPLESPNCDQGLRVCEQNPSQASNSLITNDEALFGSYGSRSTYDEMDSMSHEYQNSMGNVDNRTIKSPAVNDSHHSSTEDSTSSLLGSLQQIMSKTMNLIASSNSVAKQLKTEPKEAIKLSIQEEARGNSVQEQAVRIGVGDSRNQEEPTQDIENTERQPILTPVQETPRPVCSHYQRRCLVRFPCCGKFYPCHRCHNESKDCSEDKARASNATHIRCSICYHEQVIDEQSQICVGCKSKMSEYFCASCKHFTSVDKNPFHCDKCGICRIHRDRSFHCDVCNVCLDKRLQGKHKCRPDSGHDECCICLEDAFSGCQILPCSHKVHKDCAIAMLQNGVRSCPICRHPLFSQPENSPQ